MYLEFKVSTVHSLLQAAILFFQLVSTTCLTILKMLFW